MSGNTGKRCAVPAEAKEVGATVKTFVAKDRDHMAVVRSLLEDKSPIQEQVLGFLKKLEAK